MTPTTRQQRLKLWKLWTHTAQHNTYRDFRETVEPIMFSEGAICVRWCGMFVCIEPDGYSHT